MKKESKGKTPLIKEKQNSPPKRDSVSFLLEDSIPSGETDRKKYVADITFFYSSIFKEKLKHFIGMQLEELAQIGRNEKANDIIRSNINCFRLMQDWFDKMSNEHFGNLEELRNSFESEEEFINKFKDEYKI